MTQYQIGIENYAVKRRALDAARGRKRQYMPFIYEARTEIASQLMAVGFQRQFWVDVDTDAPFLWMYTMGSVRRMDHSGTSATGNYNATIDIRIGGRGGRAISNSPMPWMVMCPFRPQMHVLSAAQLIAPGSQFWIELTLQNAFDPEAEIHCAIQFIGSKLYGWGGQ